MEKEATSSGESSRWLYGFLILALVLLILAVAIPNVVKARTHSARNACVANLKQIEGAKATWMLEHHKLPMDIPLPEDLYGPERYIRQAPLCPQGGTYTVGRVSEPPRCSLPGPEHRLP